MYKETFEKIKTIYEPLLEKYGDSPGGVRWSSIEKQHIRFQVIMEGIRSQNKKVLDLGCGKADLYYYMKKKNFNCEYSGYDISERMIAFAKQKYPDLSLEVCGVVQLKDAEQKFDYCVMSGLFNDQFEDNWGYLTNTLSQVWNIVSEGMIFNLMTDKVEYQAEKLAYYDIGKVFDWLKENNMKFINMRNDYFEFPYECTFYIYKEMNDYLKS